MKGAPERIRRTVEQGKVKMHLFAPSGRSIWTVVGSGREYWVEPHLDFCSCPGFYFSRLGGDGGPGGRNRRRPWGEERCYHLDSLRAAIAEKRHETVRFDDEEYGDFVSSLLREL